VKPVAGGAEQPLFTIEGNAEADRWSTDGRFLLFDYSSAKTNRGDIWAVPLFGDRKPFPVVQGPATDVWGTLSPDGKWVAYQSDESGRGEIYVVPFPGPGGKWQVSTAGGVIPLWPPGNELFYIAPDLRVFVVEIEIQGNSFVVGESRQLFGGRTFGTLTGFDISRTNKRFLFTLPVDEPNASPLILTTNWTAALGH
jgi:hypothetical protein